jgi:hypothetical protein
VGDVRDALDVAVAAATHLTKMDAGAVAAARALADKIDAWDVIVDWAMEDAAESESRPRVPQNDNVSLSALLKYLESLGLTPAGRAANGKPTTTPKEDQGGKLGKLHLLADAARPAGGAG